MSVQVSYKKQIIIFLTIFVLLIVAVEIGVRVIEHFDNNNCKFIGKDAFKNVETIKQNQICKDNHSTAYEVDGILKYTSIKIWKLLILIHMDSGAMIFL